MRPHPLSIFYDVKRWIPLLLIPLIRLFTATASPAVWREVTVVAGVIGWAAIKWANTTYQTEHVLRMNDGVIVRRSRTLAPDSTALVAVETSPLMRLCGCRKVQISTADRRRRTDATLYLAKRHTTPLIQHEIGAEGYHARTIPILIMALSGSNAAVGVLTLVPFIRRAAAVLGESFTRDWYAMPRLIVTGLPPLLEGAANLLLLGWGVAVIRGLLRTLGFRVHRQHGRLHILSGVFTKRSLYIDSKCISSLLLRQTLFTRMLGVYTATIACAGYGRETGVRPVLIPAATKRDLCRALDQLLPQFPLCRVAVRPSMRSLPRYILPPLGLIVAAGGLYVWSDVITAFPTVVVLIGGGWWFTVRLVGFFYAGIGIGDGALVMRYPRGLAFYELQLPLSSLDGLIYRQGPFQRRRGVCHVFVRCFGEKQRRHRVFGVDEAAVNALWASAV